MNEKFKEFLNLQMELELNLISIEKTLDVARNNKEIRDWLIQELKEL